MPLESPAPPLSPSLRGIPSPGGMRGEASQNDVTASIPSTPRFRRSHSQSSSEAHSTPTEGTTTAAAKLRLLSVVGAPVSSLALFPLRIDDNDGRKGCSDTEFLQLLWSQGPFLHRIELAISSPGVHHGDDSTAAAAAAADFDALRDPLQQRTATETADSMTRRRGGRQTIRIFDERFSPLKISTQHRDSSQLQFVGSLSSVSNIHGIRLCSGCRPIHQNRPGERRSGTAFLTNSSDVFLLWGGQHVALVGSRTAVPRGTNETLEPLEFRYNRDPKKDDEEREGERLPHYSLEVEDWILDCQVIGDDESSDEAERAGLPWRATLVIGTAHNCLHLVQVCLAPKTSKPRAEKGFVSVAAHVRNVFRLQGEPTSIGQSLAVCPTAELVAFGSATQGIALWSYNTVVIGSGIATARPAARALATLRGHKGVVLSIRFDEEGRKMVTASDDRSVRLWTRQGAGEDGGSGQRIEGSSWTCTWTAWGHSERCLSASFHRANCGRSPVEVVISTSEDGTARCWTTETGQCVGMIRGRTTPLWKADSCAAVVVTAANNGSLALHDLYSIMELHVDRSIGARADVDEAGSVLLRLPSQPQVVLGMDFYPASRTRSRSNLLVATRSGELFQLDGTSGTTSLRPWKSSERTIAAEITCMAIRPSGRQIAIGTKHGAVLLVSLDLTTELSGTADDSWLCHAPPRSTVKRLDWLSDSVLLSYHVDYLAWWRMSDREAIVLHPRTSGMPNCAAWDPSTQRLIVGDTRGSLVLFELSNSQFSNADSPLLVMNPISSLPRVHEKEHVTDVAWASPLLVVSVGYDGCFCQCAVSDVGRVSKLLSLSMNPFSGLERIWSLGPASTVVGGYHGNTFALMHAESGYEFTRIETGGRQRSYCVAMQSALPVLGPQAVQFAVSVNRQGGGHHVRLYRHRIFDLVASSRQGMVPLSPWSLGDGLHDETTYGLDLLSDDSGSFIAVTASEDCHARVSVLGSDGSVVISKELPSHVSSVRAVCVSSGGSSSSLLPAMIAVGGCRLTLQLFQVHRGVLTEDIRVELLCVGKIREKTTGIDQRINCVAMQVDRERGAVVASGDSNGSVFLYRLSEVDRGAVSGRLVFQAERPILSLKLTRVGRSLLLLAGTNSGELVLYDVTGLTGSGDAESCRKIYVSRPHSVGTNALDARPYADFEGGVVRICTGGDDQSIYCCDLRISGNSTSSSATLLRSAMLTNACGSAIRGISWLDECRLCAASYDQQLVVFEARFPRLCRIAGTMVPVGDVNALACATPPNGTAPSTIAVAGTGIALYNYQLER